MPLRSPCTHFQKLKPDNKFRHPQYEVLRYTGKEEVAKKSTTEAMLSRLHGHTILPNKCGSILIQTIDAQLQAVWSLVRNFKRPQAYKPFVKVCTMHAGDGGVGSIREVRLVSGLPASYSVEKLEELDDEMHVVTFSIIGGDHRLGNYRSTLSLHEEDDDDAGDGKKTVLIESYVVDVPADSSKEDTDVFATTIIRCNLRSLARVAESL